MRLPTWRAALLALAFAAAPLAAQEEPRRVALEVIVSASTERAAFVERGTEAGVAVGDRARFFPTASAPVEGVVRGATANHARVELQLAGPPLPVGTRGEIWVLPPAAPAEPGDPGTEAPADGEPASPPAEPEPVPREVPEHPPWQSPPEEWQESTPLLAPAAATPLATRTRAVSGRSWAGVRWRSADVAGGRSENIYARGGLDWRMTNPFASGGELRFNGEVYARSTDAPGSPRRQQEELRIDHLAWRRGGQRDSPRAYLLGRFYQESMPEFGQLDGVELRQRVSVEDEVGVSAGHMPPLNGELKGTDDWQTALFWRHRSTSTWPLDWRAGYQRTWHDGRPDRDLFVLDGRLRTSGHAFLSATGWLDYYGGDEGPKDPGVELSRLYLSAGQSTPEGDGLRLYYSEFRFPYLLRPEYDPAIDDGIFDVHNTRLGIDLWTRFDAGPRVRLRLDRWADEEQDGDEGYAGALGFDLPGLLPREAELGISVFGSEGVFNRDAGMRLSATTFRGTDHWSLAWELVVIDEEAAATPTSPEWQHRVYGSWDTQLLEGLSLAVDLAATFGDPGDSLSLGVFLQRSF